MAIGLSVAAIVVLAQTTDWDPIRARPLEEVRLFLENQYAKPVTYEDPVWRWAGDSVARGSEPDGPFGRWLWDRHLDLPRGVTREENSGLTATLLQRILDAYRQQNPGDTRFQVVQSSLGLHIIPAFAHDENGSLVKASSLLDTTITVPLAARMPSEHLRALCQAVGGAAGAKVDLSAKWVDRFFAPNRAVPRYEAARLLTAEEKERYSFRWGASGVPAREALIGLIDSSNTTLTWALLCQPSLKPQNRSCTLNVAPLQLTREGPDGKPIQKALSYDRCGACEFLHR
ncbi:MAG TPA: hypothetical protein VHW09_32620 [Bryobacteraceae bacterium]|jgi:hypothetical protein|nr:hypothetical protein [Bryobacteraceae bacterium]